MAGWAWAVLSIAANVSASLMLKLATKVPLAELLALRDCQGLAVLFAALGFYGVAFVAYFMTLRHIPVSLAYIAITAAAAVSLAVIGTLFLRERLDARQTVAFVLIIVGLALVVTRSAEAPAPAEASAVAND